MQILNNNLNLDQVKKYLEIEELAIRINMLKGVTKRVSFTHVRTCVEEDLKKRKKLLLIFFLESKIGLFSIIKNL